jgi:hypothetical protein
MAYDLIASSDRLINQLELQTNTITNPFCSSDCQYSDIDIIPCCEDAKTDI